MRAAAGSKQFYSTKPNSEEATTPTNKHQQKEKDESNQHIAWSSDAAYYSKRLQDLEQFEKTTSQPAYATISTVFPRTETTSASSDAFQITSYSEFRSLYESSLQNGEKLLDRVHHVKGRILAKRNSSNKLTFYTIGSDDGQQLQVMATHNIYKNNVTATSGEDEFTRMNELLKRGDIIAITGVPGKTSKGEFSIIPHNITLLAPCLHQLPHYKHETIEDNVC